MSSRWFPKVSIQRSHNDFSSSPGNDRSVISRVWKWCFLPVRKRFHLLMNVSSLAGHHSSAAGEEQFTQHWWRGGCRPDGFHDVALNCRCPLMDGCSFNLDTLQPFFFSQNWLVLQDILAFFPAFFHISVTFLTSSKNSCFDGFHFVC